MAGALGLDARTRPEAFPIKANDFTGSKPYSDFAPVVT